MTETAEAALGASDRATRRALLSAGVIGAALALAGSRSASAATVGLSDSDLDLTAFAISLELTARDLYDAAIFAGASDEIWQVMREQHESYAQRLAGISGSPADSRNEAVYEALLGGFETSNPATAAFELENVAAATHVELLASIVDANVADAVASITAMESRHATVLAAMSGRGADLDALFFNDATPLAPEART